MGTNLVEAWLLGTRYFPISSQLSFEEKRPGQEPEAVAIEEKEFLLDFRSKLWCSYRRGFEKIGSTKFTEDSGWGCMLRTAQMLLGAALFRHFLGPQWRLEDNQRSPAAANKYSTILSWFGDHAGSSCPYSLHNMALKGTMYDVQVGQWHGPTTAAAVLKVLVDQYSPGGLKAYVSNDGTVYREEVAQLCQMQDGSGRWNPVIILLPVRLGLELNTSYLPFLLETLKFPQSLGFAGGKIGLSLTTLLTFGKVRSQRAIRSMYFIGVNDHNELYYLDPHKTQPALPFTKAEYLKPENFASYHFDSLPKKTTADQIDPSLVLGFYCRDQEDFEDFCLRAEVLAKEKRPSVFVIGKGKPVYLDDPIMLGDDLDLNEWEEPEDWPKQHPESESSDLKKFIENAAGNPQPSLTKPEMTELAIFHSINGDILGAIILAQGYLIFEPLQQDPLVQKNGAERYRWWIHVSHLEDFQVMTDSSDIEDRDSDDFIILHNQIETGNQRNLRSTLDVVFGSSSSEALSPLSFPHFEASSHLEGDNHLPPRGVGYHPVIAGMVQGINIKRLLVEEFNRAVNWCHVAHIKAKNPIAQPVIEAVRLVTVIEWLFLNGLKERTALSSLTSQLYSMTHGKMPNLNPFSPPTFWPAIEKLLSPAHLNYIDKQFDDEPEKCRAWIRFSLNQNTLNAQFLALISDARLLEQIYTPDALLLDPINLDILKALFFSLQEIRFQLPIVGFDLLPEEADNEDLDADNLSPEEPSSIPSLSPPSQIRLTFRNGNDLGCFDIETPSDQTTRICQPIYDAFEKYKTPMLVS